MYITRPFLCHNPSISVWRYRYWNYYNIPYEKRLAATVTKNTVFGRFRGRRRLSLTSLVYGGNTKLVFRVRLKTCCHKFQICDVFSNYLPLRVQFCLHLDDISGDGEATIAVWSLKAQARRILRSVFYLFKIHKSGSYFEIYLVNHYCFI